jgi:2-oxoglutarate/2-oxoacid ferredoxin oxidoreductase subunit alpha
MSLDVNFMIGGEAGQGVQSAGLILAKTLARGGLHIFADQDYESRVRGGHNFFRVRARDSKAGAIREDLDVLLALDQESVTLHHRGLSRNGVVIFDSDKPGEAKVEGNSLGVPLEKLAQEKGGSKLIMNMVGLGAAMSVVGYDRQILKDTVTDYFGGGNIGQSNAAAILSGYEYAEATTKSGTQKRLKPVDGQRRMLLNGNEAIALGALAAGCKFVAAYPMTPSTSIMEYMAGKSDDLGVVVVQPEDEIAAINMIVGAAFSGVRAMTVTSGGGFCLMVEGVGLAGMTETPIVVVEGQRAGPAIGLPTRTEQGDLLFVLHASHGDFPRVVLAPGSVEDAFWITVKAFNLAEQYQVPVIILTDQYLASSYETVDRFDLSQVPINRGELLDADDISRLGPYAYKRHAITPSGVSPRVFPGREGALVVTDSDEHDEAGHIIEDAETRSSMMRKRLRKNEGLKKEIAGPKTYGPEQADMTIIGWGSTYGVLKEAVDLAAGEGPSVNMVCLSELWPFPAEAVDHALRGAKRTVVVENNATGQFARLLRAETGHPVNDRILKFDGRPFSPSYVIDKLREGVA